MIGPLAAAVAADLKRRKFPYPVSYGPERVVRDGFSAAIVFVRDRKAGDQITAPAGANGVNPEVPFNRFVSGAFTVYARSPKPGATVADHEEECDCVCDGVLSAMVRILKARRLPLRVVESRLLDREELTAELGGGASENHAGARSADWPGCAARVRFAVGTAVLDVTYQGHARPTGVVGDVACPVITSDNYPDFDPADP